jgi:hypothetical protein
MRGVTLLFKSWRAALLATLLAALFAASASALAGARSEASPTGTVIFCEAQSGRACSKAIYAASGDGSGIHRLAATPVTPQNLDASPDGSRYLFAGSRGGSDYGLYLGTLTGQIRRIATGYINGFDWAPNGKLVAYATSNSPLGTASSLFIVSASGRGARRLITAATCRSKIDSRFDHAKSDGTSPLFSLDGSALIYKFVRDPHCGGRIEHGLGILSLRGGAARTLRLDHGFENLVALGFRDASHLFAIDILNPGSSYARLLDLHGRTSPLLPGDPSVLPPNNEQLTEIHRPVSPDRHELLLALHTCSSGTLCSYVDHLFDVSTKRPSDDLPGDPAGWARDGSLLTYSVDDGATSTTLTLSKGVGLTEAWAGSLAAAAGELVWAG